MNFHDGRIASIKKIYVVDDDYYSDYICILLAKLTNIIVRKLVYYISKIGNKYSWWVYYIFYGQNQKIFVLMV
jgi:hypothetical protein